jgi:hypothetical protein
MYARIVTGPDSGSTTAAEPGCCPPTARYVLRGPAGDCTVTLWRTLCDTACTAVVPGVGRNLLYEVVAHGERTGEVARTAAVMWFDGPLDDDRLARLGSGCGERIPSALESTPGFVRCIVGWHAATRAAVEVLLATSTDAIDAAGLAVNAPWTGSACGPDTLESYAVVATAPG